MPIPGLCGPLEKPNALPLDRSFAPSVLGDTVVAPFNEPELAADLIASNADELACVIVEPVQGSMGMVPASEEYLQALREATRRHDVLLIFDEVITLRTSVGGAQQHYGIEPDLTAMGKFIGGGLPIGAFGGRRELLEIFNPDRPDHIFHASTFSGNALSMAAGVAAVTDLTHESVERLNALGARLRDGFDRAFDAVGIPGRAIGLGSLANIVLTRQSVRNARDVMGAMIRAGPIGTLLHLGMLRRGIFAAGRGMYGISTAMGEAEVDLAIDALRDSLDELRPVVENERPQLMNES